MNIDLWIRDEIRARKDELWEAFVEYRKDVGDHGEDFYKWARTIIEAELIEEGVIEDKG